MKSFLTIFLFCMFTSTAWAEGSVKGGDEFRKTAKEYQQLASDYRGKGHPEIAKLYTRMSEIKLDAASKADKGHWDDIDWTEYFKLEEMLIAHKK